MRIERYAEHHVLLGEDTWTIEHPITCDLNSCDEADAFMAAEAQWGRPPQPDGWYMLTTNPEHGGPVISEASERHVYEVTEVLA